MIDHDPYASLAAHLKDLQEKSERWHTHTSSSFLNEEEQAAMSRMFPEGPYIRYDGGYEGAQRRKIIFRYDEDDNWTDVVCIGAKIDQRFRKITHRDVLGAMMHLQIERNTTGDLWVEEDHIYIYTTADMAPFLVSDLMRVNQLNVSFEILMDHPIQIFNTKELHVVMASERADAVVAALTHCSRSQAKELIRAGAVQLDHVMLEEPDEVCNNNVAISIRGIGRFVYLGYDRTTKNGRIAAVFRQYI